MRSVCNLEGSGSVSIRCVIILVLVVAAPPRSTLWGRTECDALHPLPNSSLQYRDRGNRCEGVYIAEIGTKSLELVSFQDGSIAPQLTPGEVLRVSVPGQTGLVHVRAVGLPAKTYYRMDTTLSGGASLLWPVDEVLLPEHLNANRIGIFAWKAVANEKVFLPVHIESSRSGATRAVPFLILRLFPNVDKVRWRSAPFRDEHCAVAGPWRDANQAANGEQVRVSLAGFQGRHCIDVTAHAESSNEWAPPLEILVEVPAK